MTFRPCIPCHPGPPGPPLPATAAPRAPVLPLSRHSAGGTTAPCAPWSPAPQEPWVCSAAEAQIPPNPGSLLPVPNTCSRGFHAQCPTDSGSGSKVHIHTPAWTQ